MIGGSKLSNFKIGDQTCKMIKIRGPKLQLNLKNFILPFFMFFQFGNLFRSM
jgi:hypothetical protein